MMKIYGLIRDGGDGSASLSWYKDKKKVKKLLKEEEYYQNEGSPAVTLTLPDDTNLAAVGISLYDED